MLPKKTQIAFFSQTSYIKLKQPFQVFSSASYSAVLSLAALIVYHNPHLTPPNYSGNKTNKNNIDQFLADRHLSYNHYYQLWCDYLTQCLQNSKAYLNQNLQSQCPILYFIDKVPNQFILCLNSDIMQTINYDHNKNHQFQDFLKIFFGVIYQKPMKKLNIGIANFATSQLRTDPFRPKVHLSGLIQGIWFGNHSWTQYKILKPNYPTNIEFQKMDVLILTGSSLGVNDQVPEVQKFIQIVKQAVKNHKKLKIIGFCFGHQFLAKAFGGKIIKKIKYAGIQNIKFIEENISSYKFYKKFKNFKRQTLALSQYHSDYIQNLPENFINIGTSNSCEYESMISKDGRMISFQYHPEYTTQYTKGYQFRVKRYDVSDVLHDFCGTGGSSQQHTQSVWCMRQVIMDFINQ